eukprot:CAMPEP_0174852064 /NCGR_PEP_ID=MMETSP1114-20130205/25170_1 /TAXON_ID=312471 /ORGANISM="Neobodo designis, Strain CCAP 1951/1" /LENGTH=115 /DNA_ID=CAMNT_0016086639 /DNA_START=366 /DNA_END=713 /DNA_ORIENTATION=-
MVADEGLKVAVIVPRNVPRADNAFVKLQPLELASQIGQTHEPWRSVDESDVVIEHHQAHLLHKLLFFGMSESRRITIRDAELQRLRMLAHVPAHDARPSACVRQLPQVDLFLVRR